MKQREEINLKPWTEGNRLVTVRTYSQKMGVTTQQVYNWIKSGKVRELVIDGVKFIIEE